MPQYHRVSPRFWPDMRGETQDTKLAGAFILTNEHRATEGLYRLPVDYIAHDLEMAAKRVRQALGALEAREFISYDPGAGIVLINKALTYRGQAPVSDAQVTGAMRAIENLPPTPLMDTFASLACTHAPHLYQRLCETNGHTHPDTHD